MISIPWDDYASAPPHSIVIAGDWHGNQMWALHAITQASHRLPAAGVRIIIHLGDFGVWPGKNGYIPALSRILRDKNMMLWFLDGNHDDHHQIAVIHDQCDDAGPVPMDDDQRIWHLPRGTRWSWHGIRWLAVGGAGSPDWQRRAPGYSWWPEEVISADQVATISASGVADILLAHDCPGNYTPPCPPPPLWWDLDYCRISARRLQDITNAVQPMLIMHGHFHTNRNDTVDTPWGRVQVVGFDMDGESANYRLVECASMKIPSRITS